MDQTKNLRLFNVLMGVLHVVQGCIILAISTSFSLPVMTHYLGFDLATKSLLPESEKITELGIAPLVALFFFFSAAAHLIVSLPKVYEWYVANLKKGLNYARWYEYSVSSSVMIVIIAMLVGVYDLSSLILLFFMNAMMILWGLMMERHNQLTKKTDWLPFWMGTLAGMIPWVVVALYLFGSGKDEMGPPTFVYWIFFSIFLFFNVFAVNMVLQYRKAGKWKDYIYGEKMYIRLSLLAKSVLAWQVFAGTLRPV